MVRDADTRLAFLLYLVSVSVFAAVMVYRIAPKYGKTNPLIYLSICSTVGSVSVMAVKAFGIALKLTFAGNNQFTHPSTYVFLIVTTVSILVQMNYFNKALSQFPTNMCAIPFLRELLSFPHPCIANIVLDQCQPPLLRYVHDVYPLRLVHSLQRLQHYRPGQHLVAALRVPRDVYRRLSPEPESHGSQRNRVARPSRRWRRDRYRHDLEHSDAHEHGGEEVHGESPKHW